jgi:hypothetical protein
VHEDDLTTTVARSTRTPGKPGYHSAQGGPAERSNAFGRSFRRRRTIAPNRLDRGVDLCLRSDGSGARQPDAGDRRRTRPPRPRGHVLGAGAVRRPNRRDRCAFRADHLHLGNHGPRRAPADAWQGADSRDRTAPRRDQSARTDPRRGRASRPGRPRRHPRVVGTRPRPQVGSAVRRDVAEPGEQPTLVHERLLRDQPVEPAVPPDAAAHRPLPATAGHHRRRGLHARNHRRPADRHPSSCLPVRWRHLHRRLRVRIVGPCLAERVFQPDWAPQHDDVPVVLVSLGTAYNNRPDFYRMVAASAAGHAAGGATAAADAIARLLHQP